MKKRAPQFTKEGVRAFLDRPWHIFEDTRLEEERRRYEADPSSAFASSEELSDHIRAVHGKIDPWLRREDFEDHVRLRRLMDRVSRDYATR